MRWWIMEVVGFYSTKMQTPDDIHKVLELKFYYKF